MTEQDVFQFQLFHLNAQLDITQMDLEIVSHQLFNVLVDSKVMDREIVSHKTPVHHQQLMFVQLDMLVMD
jgi:hypothetical protein